MIKNNMYIIKIAWENDKRLFLLSFIFAIVKAFKPLLILLYPKLLIEVLLKGESSISFIYKIAIVSLFLFFCCYVIEYLDGVIYSKIMRIRNIMTQDFAKICMKMKYEYTENEEKLDEIHMAFQAISNNKDGIEGALKAH